MSTELETLCENTVAEWVSIVVDRRLSVTVNLCLVYVTLPDVQPPM